MEWRKSTGSQPWPHCVQTGRDEEGDRSTCRENCSNLGKRRQRLAPVYRGGGSEKRLDSDLKRLLTFQAETVNRGSDIKVWIWWWWERFRLRLLPGSADKRKTGLRQTSRR